MINEVTGRKACLVVIDGWGLSAKEGSSGDAIRLARNPVMDELAGKFGCASLEAHGEAVGLPAGLMGNSEVGHLNIGAGRIVYQDILRIDQLLKQPEPLPAISDIISRQGRLHLIGLVSDGGVHSHQRHLLGLLDLLARQGQKHVAVHAITDGRDTAPKCCLPYLAGLQDHISKLNEEFGCQYALVSVIGRYYAMDRDKRWERTKIAYESMTAPDLMISQSLQEAIVTQYEAGSSDEFLLPIILKDDPITSGDSLLFFNFRSDRMRQIVQAFFDPSILPDLAKSPVDLHITTMTKYREDFDFPLLSPPQSMTNVLAEWISKQGLAQMHVAETEKFSHVTVFFNGGRESKFPGEERILVPSPKVATYDLCPEMSCGAVAEAVVGSIQSGQFPFVMCNLAPPDMVGHTGCLHETVQAVEATDAAIGRIWTACQRHEYTLLVTADHGNAEQMVDPMSGGPHKAHTCAPVPLIVSSGGLARTSGALCDVAPTVLTVMGLPKPAEMTGSSLI